MSMCVVLRQHILTCSTVYTDYYVRQAVAARWADTP